MLDESLRFRKKWWNPILTDLPPMQAIIMNVIVGIDKE